MRAKLKYIESNDYPNWEAFEAAEVTDPLDHFGWFTVEVGDDQSEGGEIYQVVISTPAAISEAKRSSGRQEQGKPFRGIVVPIFDPKVVEGTVQELLAGQAGQRWEEIREQLMKFMYWELEK